MPAKFTNVSLVATTNVAPVSGVTIWRWLVLLAQKWANTRKLSRDIEFLRTAPQSILSDIGVNRQDVDIICREGRQR